MEEVTLSTSMLFPQDITRAIVKHLDFNSAVNFIHTCTTHYNVYYKGLPAHIAQNYDQITEKELRKVQFGVNRLLYENPIFCTNETKDEHLYALIHYAQHDNTTMIEHIITHENDKNRKNRVSLLLKFFYITSKDDDAGICDVTKNVLTYKGVSPNLQQILSNAYTYDTSDIIKICIKNGFDMQQTCHSNGNTPLHVVSASGSLGIMHILIKNKVNIDPLNAYKQTPLHLAVKHGLKRCAKLLIKNGANINAEDKELNTPLNYAAYRGHETLVKLLLQKNADASLTNKSGFTALHYAEEQNHQNIIALFKEYGVTQSCITS